MRELRAIRVSDDGKEILLTETTGMQGADAPPDAGLPSCRRRPIASHASATPTTTENRPESALSPREIQSRLRAGDTAEEVAEAAGIPVARVARYEAPIAAERVRIVDEVRRATAPGPHRVSPGRQLGAVVDDRLADDGLDPVLAQWLARRRPDGTWLVTVDLADHHAEWSWDGAGPPRARPRRRRPAPAQPVPQQRRVADRGRPGHRRHRRAGSAPAPPRSAQEPPAPLAPARAVGESTVSDDRLRAGRCPRVPASSCCRAKALHRRSARAQAPRRRRRWTTSRAPRRRLLRRRTAGPRTGPPATTRFPARAASPSRHQSAGAVGFSRRRVRRRRRDAAAGRAARTSGRQVRQAPQRGAGLGRHRLRRPPLVTSRLRFQNVPCL